MYSLPLINLQDFEEEISGHEEFNPVYSHPQLITLTENTQQNIPGTLSMENVGNGQSQQLNTESNEINLKQTQNTASQGEKQVKSEYTETLAVFQRIYSKIVSSYLGQISYSERKSSKKVVYFDKCDLFSNLQLQSSFTTLKQVINRSQLQFAQKCNLMSFLDSQNQLRLFLSNILSNSYEEVNNEFIYFIYDMVQELKPLILRNEDSAEDTSESSNLEHLEKEKESLGSQKEEKLMKKQLEEIGFFQRIFYQKTIKYLNCQEISSPVSDEKVKQSFIRFARLYSHLVIKLIIMDMPTFDGQKQSLSAKKINSSDERVMEMKKEVVQGKNKNSCEILGNWFLSCSVAKSFNSINSLGSINMNNLNDIKIYNSKPDLWSQADEDNYYDFSDEEFETINKRRI